MQLLFLCWFRGRLKLDDSSGCKGKHGIPISLLNFPMKLGVIISAGGWFRLCANRADCKGEAPSGVLLLCVIHLYCALHTNLTPVTVILSEMSSNFNVSLLCPYAWCSGQYFRGELMDLFTPVYVILKVWSTHNSLSSIYYFLCPSIMCLCYAPSSISKTLIYTYPINQAMAGALVLTVRRESSQATHPLLVQWKPVW